MKCRNVALAALLSAGGGPSSTDGFLPNLFKSNKNRHHHPKNTGNKIGKNDDGVASHHQHFVSLDSSRSFAGLSGSDGRPNDDSIRKAYDSWRLTYNKGTFDAMRYENFKRNYVKLSDANTAAMKKARMHGVPLPKPLELNEFGDCSTAEYNAMRSMGDLPDDGRGDRSATADDDQQTRRQLESMEAGYQDFQDYTASASSSSGPGTLGRSEDPEARRIRDVYNQWCQDYGKEFSEDRLQVFGMNLRQVEKYQEETGKVLKLNEHSDLTQEEYNLRYTSSYAPESMAINQISNSTTSAAASSVSFSGLNSRSAPERVMNAYREWCAHFGKEPSDQRLQIFQNNFLQVEEYYKSTGIAIKINEFADLSPDEYKDANQEENGAGDSRRSATSSTFGGGNGSGGVATDQRTGGGRMRNVADARIGNNHNVNSDYAAAIESYMQSNASNQNSKRKKEETVNERAEKLKDHFVETYREYCEYYHKQFDASRIPLFKNTIIEINRQLLTTGERIELDEYADLTKEEATARRKALQDANARIEQDKRSRASEEAYLLKEEYASRQSQANARAEEEARRRDQFAESAQRMAQMGREDELRRAEEQSRRWDEAQRRSGFASADAQQRREAEEDQFRAQETPRIQAGNAGFNSRQNTEADRRLAELEEMLRAEAEARAKAEQEAERLAEENAKIKAAEEARRKAFERAKENPRPYSDEAKSGDKSILWNFFQKKKEQSSQYRPESSPPSRNDGIPEKVRIAYEKWTEFYNRPFDESRLPIFYDNLLQVEEYLKQSETHLNIDVYENPAKLNKHADRTVDEYKEIQASAPAAPPVEPQQTASSEPLMTVSDGAGTGPNFPSGGSYAAKMKSGEMGALSGGSVSSPDNIDISGPVNTPPPKKSKGKVRIQSKVRYAYKKWCEMNQKPMDESRLEIFQENYLRAEEHYKSEHLTDFEMLAKLNSDADMTGDEYNRMRMQEAAAAANTSPPPPPQARSKKSAGAEPLITITNGGGGPGPTFPSGGSYVAKLKGLPAEAASANNSGRLSSIPQGQLNDLSSLMGASGSAPPPFPEMGTSGSIPSPVPEAMPHVPDKVRNAYAKWCEHYSKPFDESRLPVFQGNLEQVEKHLKNSNFPVQIDVYKNPEKLNKNADRTVSEYNEIKSGEPSTSSPSGSVSSSGATDLDYARRRYTDWCKQYNKQYDESRFRVFADNLKAKEKYEKESGETVNMNEFSDLTPEEFKAKISAGGGGSSASEPLISVTDGGGRGPNFPSGGSYMAKLRGDVDPDPYDRASAPEPEFVAPSKPLRSEPPPSPQSSGNSNDSIRDAYMKWCKINSKPFDDSRIPNFKRNYNKVKEFYQAKGGLDESEIPGKLNEHADMTVEEYQQAMGSSSSSLSKSSKASGGSSPLIQEVDGGDGLGPNFPSGGSYVARMKGMSEKEIKASAGAGRRMGSIPQDQLNDLTSISAGGMSFSNDQSFESPAAPTHIENGPGMDQMRGSTSPPDTQSEKMDLASVMDLLVDDFNSPDTTSYAESDASTELEPRPAPIAIEPERLRQAYIKWCNHYGKSFDELRLQYFEENLMQMQTFFEMKNKDVDLCEEPSRLNEYADRTKEEHKEIREKELASKSMRHDDANEDEVMAPQPKPSTDNSSMIMEEGSQNFPSMKKPEMTPVPDMQAETTSNKMAAGGGLREAYAKWCEHYNKDFEESRLPIYEANLIQMQKFFEMKNKDIDLRENPSHMNEHADRTKEEYRLIQESELLNVATPHDDAKKDDPSRVPEEIRIAYKEWASYYEKEYDESRLPTFQENFIQIQKYYKKVGKDSKIVRLNEHADRTKEEHKEIQAGKILPSSHDATKPTKKPFETSATPVPKAEESRQVSTPTGNQPSVDAAQLEPKAEKCQEVPAPSNQSSIDTPEPKAEHSVPESIRVAYISWCKFYKKEFDEARLPTFQENFKSVEAYYKSKGSPIKLNEGENIVKLNEHADRTVEEYKELMEVSSKLKSEASTSQPKKPLSEIDKARKSFSANMERPGDDRLVGAEMIDASAAEIKAKEVARKREAQRIAEEKAAAVAAAKLKAEEEARLEAQQKATEEARLKAEEEFRNAKEKAEAEAKAKAEEELSLAKEKVAEEKRIAQEKAAAAEEAKAKAAAEEMAAAEKWKQLEAEAERLAELRKQLEADQAAVKKATAEKAKLAEAERLAELRKQLEADQAAVKKAAAEKARLENRKKVEAERAAARKAQAERLAAKKAEEEKQNELEADRLAEEEALIAQFQSQKEDAVVDHAPQTVSGDAKSVDPGGIQPSVDSIDASNPKGSKTGNIGGKADRQREKDRLFQAVEEVLGKAKQEKQINKVEIGSSDTSADDSGSEVEEPTSKVDGVIADISGGKENDLDEAYAKRVKEDAVGDKDDSDSKGKPAPKVVKSNGKMPTIKSNGNVKVSSNDIVEESSNSQKATAANVTAVGNGFTLLDSIKKSMFK